MTQEESRLQEARKGTSNWKKWGPYLSERQWGTVREDYSEGGDAWNYFSHDQARSRAYRWGEDGLAGISDDKQRLCFALALWNGKDPILKERLFGLTNSEGNHGEDVLPTGDRTRPNCISCRHSGSGTTGHRGLPNRTELPGNRTSSRSRERGARARSR